VNSPCAILSLKIDVMIKNLAQKIKQVLTPEWISALSTLGVLLLGMYGFFFTNIPREVVEALNKEIVALKAEKVSLSEQLSVLENEEKKLSSEVSELSNVRKEYLERVAEAVITGFTNELFRLLDEQYIIAEKAEQLQVIYDFLDAMRKRSLNEEAQDLSVPSAWRHEELIWGLRMHKWCWDCEPPKSETFDDVVKAFHNEILYSKDKKSGFDALTQALEVPPMKLLVADDYNSLVADIEAYSRGKSDLYKKSVLVDVKEDASVKDIKLAAQRVKGNISDLKEDIKALEVNMRSSLKALTATK
jgi:hypothetical protein